jgi:hypothetical protein
MSSAANGKNGHAVAEVPLDRADEVKDVSVEFRLEFRGFRVSLPRLVHHGCFYHIRRRTKTRLETTINR